MSNTERPAKAVYTILKRKLESDFWLRIGSAHTNRDGSINVYLDALPFDAKLHIREQAARAGQADTPPAREPRWGMSAGDGPQGRLGAREARSAGHSAPAAVGSRATLKHGE